MAKLTARTSSSGVWLYSWEEYQGQANTATRVQAYPGRQGSSTVSPAYEVNNQEVAVNTLVLMWCRGAVNGQVAYEFASPDGSLAGNSVVGTLDVAEADGSNTLTAIDALRFDRDDGLVLTNVSAGVARVDLLAATGGQAGGVSTSAQQFGGEKTFLAGLAVGPNSFAATVAYIYLTTDDAEQYQRLVATRTVLGNITSQNRLTPGVGLNGAGIDMESSAATVTDTVTILTAIGAVAVFGRVGVNRSIALTAATLTINAVAAASGTDPLGNVFTLGLCTTVGSGTAYTDEMAQDAVGGILTDSSEIDFTYSDATPSITASLINNSVAYARLVNAAGAGLLGRAADSSGALAMISPANDYEIPFRQSDNSIAWGFPDARSLSAVVARAFRNVTSGTISVPNSTWTTVTCPAENYDTDALHDNSTNSERLTVPSGMDGLWFIWVELNPQYTAGGLDTAVRIRINGGALTERTCLAGVTSTLVYVQAAAAGDYFDAQISHGTGATRDFPDGGGYLSIAAFYLGKTS